MLPTEHLAAFLLTALVLILAPGPSVLFVIARSLTLGRRAGLASVVGNSLGIYVQVIAVAVGIGALVQESIAVYTTVKLLGAVYLAYLGIQAIRHRHALTRALDDADVRPVALGRIVRDGFAVGVANPKTIVFMAAILPQFVDRSTGHVPLQLLTLGAMFFVIGIVCDGSWAIAAGTARRWLERSPRRLAAIGATGGVVMIGLGAGLAISGRPADR